MKKIGLIFSFFICLYAFSEIRNNRGFDSKISSDDCFMPPDYAGKAHLAPMGGAYFDGDEIKCKCSGFTPDPKEKDLFRACKYESELPTPKRNEKSIFVCPEGFKIKALALNKNVSKRYCVPTKQEFRCIDAPTVIGTGSCEFIDFKLSLKELKEKGINPSSCYPKGSPKLKSLREKCQDKILQDCKTTTLAIQTKSIGTNNSCPSNQERACMIRKECGNISHTFVCDLNISLNSKNAKFVKAKTSENSCGFDEEYKGEADFVNFFYERCDYIDSN